MDSFSGRLAVVTGGASGMGAELCVQLAAEGASVAACDLTADRLAATVERCEAAAPEGVRVTAHGCDVADEAQVTAFRDAVVADHATDHVDLLFNNAGIGGGGAFVDGDRAEWERTFDICWWGVYHCTRAFMPLLQASEEGHIVNTSSVNGFWGSVGPDVPHTAYSTAKFAVRGFTESLMTDLRLNAPHVSAHVVMPGHIGTSIVHNSMAMLGGPDPTVVRKRLAERGVPVDQLSDEQLLAFMEERARAFREDAPTSAAEAATTILDAVKAGRWRILVGRDAHDIDELVRAHPEEAYRPEFMERIFERGHFVTLTGRDLLRPADEESAAT
jgi:NAD(P)-dependent dehydrogenase (short-subunit alcohol dehydrogenase family)